MIKEIVKLIEKYNKWEWYENIKCPYCWYCTKYKKEKIKNWLKFKCYWCLIYLKKKNVK